MPNAILSLLDFTPRLPHDRYGITKDRWRGRWHTPCAFCRNNPVSMKGSPPFSRTPVTCEFQTPAFAGMGSALSKAFRRPHFDKGPVKIISTPDAVWASIPCGVDGWAHVRLFNERHGLSKITVSGRTRLLLVKARGALGKYRAEIRIEETPVLLVRTTVSMEPVVLVRLGDTSHDVCLTDRSKQLLCDGLVFTARARHNAAQVFTGVGSSTLLYFQNLTALGDYAAESRASLLSCVGVEWPLLGTKLPAANESLTPGTTYVLSDAFVRVGTRSDPSESALSHDFLDGIATIYRRITPLPGAWYDWSKAAVRTLRALQSSKLCRRKVGGQVYFNAYLGSTEKPPESMVQGALIVALLEYQRWAEKAQPLLSEVGDSLSSFFLDDLGTMARWLPGVKFTMDDPSEEEKADRIDSWYLLHSMMNLARLGEMGRQHDKELFLACLPYVVRVARHFDHDWPVFYNRRTLSVFKRETADGEGGEQDSVGLYAHVMMQAWHLTGDPVYSAEAEAAAKKLLGLGFGILYQANNTMFTAVALARMWRATGNTLYLDLSIVCMGSLFSHLWLSEPRRSNSPLKTFMGLPPLHDAPYIAAYEEAEIFMASRTYLAIIGESAPAALEELIVEYGKHLLGRGRFYFPGELPAEVIATEPKEGIIDRVLAVPVEDLYPSEEPAGQVGQEVYGAALALLLTTASFHRWKEIPFLLYCDTPLRESEFVLMPGKGGDLTVKLRGAAAHPSTLRIIPRSPRDTHTYRLLQPGQRRRSGSLTPEGHQEFEVPGGSDLKIEWRKTGTTEG